jgi:hypothetical protein
MQEDQNLLIQICTNADPGPEEFKSQKADFVHEKLLKVGMVIGQKVNQCCGPVLVPVRIPIGIQLFISMRIQIRIQEAKPMQIRIWILVRIKSHNKLKFYMKKYIFFRIRIHFIRIQHFRLTTYPDLDPIRIRIRIQGLMNKSVEKSYS